MNELGRRIDIILKRKNMSMGDLSELTKIPKTTLHRYMNGKFDAVPISRVTHIAKMLGVNNSWLMGIQDTNEIQSSHFDAIAKYIDPLLLLNNAKLITILNEAAELSDTQLDLILALINQFSASTEK